MLSRRRRTGRSSPAWRTVGAAVAAVALLALVARAAAQTAQGGDLPVSAATSTTQPASRPTASLTAAPPAAPSTPVAPTASVSPSAPAAPVWTARLVRAAGVRQWIECAGRGPVTVVVISGLQATHTMWDRVLPSFARTTRTCVYDRPGLGGSPARSPHAVVDAGLHADELMALLDADHVTGPLVVVAHSYGGLVARAFVARHASRVAGLMLLEGVAPYDRLSPYWPEGGDRIDMVRSSAAALPMRLGSLPLVVEAAQDPDRDDWGGPSYGSTADDLADWRAHQQAAASLSTSSTYVVVARSAHIIERDRPDAVVAGLRLLVRAAEGRSPLPRCALAAYGVQPLCP